MESESQLQVIIVDKNAGNLGDALGITTERAKFLEKRLVEFEADEKNDTAKIIRLISLECVSENELAAMCYIVGREDMRIVLAGIIRELQ